MNYNYAGDHDEDDLPIISPPISSLTRRISNDDDDDDDDDDMNITDNHRPDKLLGNWQNLYETSINSLQLDDEDQRSTTQKSFYFDRQLSYGTPPEQRARSPVNQPEEDLNSTKSRWQIRLPQLLNGTVGPDRQQRDATRRHTTSMIFQRPNSQTNEFDSSSASQMPNGMEGDQPISPLVKQIKQKFDRMIVNNTTNNSLRNPTNFQSGGPKLHRVFSLTSRGSTANNGEQILHRPRPMLPIRSSTDINHVKPRSVSSISYSSNMSTTNVHPHRNKTGPPVSYPKHFYPPPSTISVVRQLIGGGATLVYDSLTHQTTSNTTRRNFKHKINVQETTENLKKQVVSLTGRQVLPDAPGEKVTKFIETISYNDSKSDSSHGNDIYEEPISRRPTISSIERHPSPTTDNDYEDPANEIERYPAPTTRNEVLDEPSGGSYYAEFDADESD